MTIRKATDEDLLYIIEEIKNKAMDYNTAEDVKNDIANNRLFVAVENNVILGSVAVVYKAHRGYYAIMRMCVYHTEYRGKGIATALIQYIISLDLGVYGATPWNDNPAMIHIFIKFGFTYQYTFNKKYEFYKKNA